MNRPRIGFDGYKEEWQKKRLGDIAELIGGGTPNTKKPRFWNGDINWYTPEEIGIIRFLNESKRKITKEGYDNCSAKLLPKGTILFTSRAGIGKTAILNNSGCTNQGFQSIVPNVEKLDSYFCFSKSKDLMDYGKKNSGGSTFREVSGKQMSEMVLTISSIPEQRLIGSFFRSLDDLIESQEVRVKKLRSGKCALLSLLFPENDRVPRLRFPGFIDEWKECKLGDVVKVVGGNAWKHSDYDEYGKYLVITITNVTGDQYIRDDVGNYINCDASNCFILQKDDILISLTGNVGRVSKMSGVKAVLNQRVGKIIPINDKIDNNFLFSILNNPSFEKQMDFEGQGAAQKNISNTNVLSYDIKLPSLSEQRLIGSFFRTLDTLIESEEFRLLILRGAKKALLSGMFV